MVEYTYDAWGTPLTKTGTLATTLGYLNPFRYRGYVFDEETGLYYLRSRYYNPVWGRFINTDSRCGEVGVLYSNNLFCYCSNSWIGSIDTEGQKECHLYPDWRIGGWSVLKEQYDIFKKAAKDYKNFTGKDLQVVIPAIDDRGIIYTPDIVSVTYTVKEQYHQSLAPDVPGICFALSENSSQIGDAVQAIAMYFGINNPNISSYVSAGIQMGTEAISRIDIKNDSHPYKEHRLKISYILAYRTDDDVTTFTSCIYKGCTTHCNQ